MERYALSDADWQRLAPLLPGRPGTRGRSGVDNRRFLDAVNYVARNGGPWRDLPARYGKWNTVWQRLFEHFQDPDLDWLLLDSTSVRAQQRRGRGRDGVGERPRRQLGASGLAPQP